MATHYLDNGNLPTPQPEAKTFFTRRRFIRTTALLTGAVVSGNLLAACGDSATATPATSATGGSAGTGASPTGSVTTVAGAAPNFDWRKYVGTSLSVLLLKNDWSDNLVKMLPDFEKLTGMKVQYEELPEQQARQKLTVDFAGGASYDAFFTSLHVEKERYSKAGWYAPLNDYLKNGQLTAPDYDYEGDILPSAKEAITTSDGKIVGLPIYVDVWILFYRKDLLADKGLKPPTTLDELEAAVKALHNPPNMYGFVGRGLKNANVPSWGYLLRAMGGDYLTSEGKANINSAQGVQALQYYANLMKGYGPQGDINFNWPEASGAFAQGQVAFYYDGVNFAPQFEDPTKSKVAGKVGYSLLPKGPAGQIVPSFPNAIAVSGKSKNKEAAYLFAQWCTGKNTVLKEQLAGVGGSRQSAWDNPQVKAQSKMPQEWSNAYLDSLKVARLGLPLIASVTEFRDIAGVAISNAIGGMSPKDALDKANKDFQDLLDKTPK